MGAEMNQMQQTGKVAQEGESKQEARHGGKFIQAIKWRRLAVDGTSGHMTRTSTICHFSCHFDRKNISSFTAVDVRW